MNFNSIGRALRAASILAFVVITTATAACANASAQSALPTQVAVVQATVVPPTPTAVPVSTTTNTTGGARVTGNFASARQAALAFQIPGRLKELKVKEGDRVKQGDLLASLDTTLLEFQIAQAQAAIGSAQAAVALAQARLKQTETPASAETIAAAQAAVKAAEANFARVSQGPSQDELALAKSNLDRAQAAVEQAQALYDRAGGAANPVSGLLPTSLALEQATAGYQAALAAYNLAKNHPTIAELAGAAAQLAQAKSVIAQLTPTAENLAIAQAGVAQAQASVMQAQAAFDLAQAGTTNATIVAPMDGTVVLTGPKVGEYVNPGVPIVTLADLSKMQVVANVDEITLNSLKIGQTATLYADALGEITLPARISKIGLWATSSGGVTSVPVTLDVDATDANVFPGLSATVEFQAP